MSAESENLPQTRLNALREAVKKVIKETIPALASVESQFGRLGLEEMARLMVRPPSVRVAIISADFTPALDARLEAEVTLAAFIVTEGKNRDEQAWDIAEAICCLIRGNQLWGLTKISAPIGPARAAPLISAVDGQKGFSVSGIEWKHKLLGLGEGLYDEEGRALIELARPEDAQ